MPVGRFPGLKVPKILSKAIKLSSCSEVSLWGLVLIQMASGEVVVGLGVFFWRSWPLIFSTTNFSFIFRTFSASFQVSEFLVCLEFLKFDSQFLILILKAIFRQLWVISRTFPASFFWFSLSIFPWLFLEITIRVIIFTLFLGLVEHVHRVHPWPELGKIFRRVVLLLMLVSEIRMRAIHIKVFVILHIKLSVLHFAMIKPSLRGNSVMVSVRIDKRLEVQFLLLTALLFKLLRVF